MAASNRKKTTNSTKKTTGNTKKQTAASNRQGSTRKPKEKDTEFMSGEITILISFAVCVLLFLSNLGVCGSFGTVLFHLQRGSFGMLGYLFPIGLFAGILFYLSNRYDSRAMVKLTIGIGLWLVICGLISLMTTGEYESKTTIGEYYQLALTRLDGGAIGGIFLKLLCPTIGRIGAYIVVILLITIGIVCITEKSVLQPLGKGSRKAYSTVKEETVRRHEEHAAKVEERRRYRMEQKVSGVAMDTVIGDTYPVDEEFVFEEEEPEEETEERQPVKKQPVEKQPVEKRTVEKQPVESSLSDRTQTQPTPSDRVIPVRGYQMPSRETPLMPETSVKTDPSGVSEAQTAFTEEIPQNRIPVSGDILIPKKDTRTLSELEALDSLKENVFTDRIHFSKWDASPEEEEPDIKRVVTSNGKVIEVEIDPEEDPLEYKRMQNRLAEQRAKQEAADRRPYENGESSQSSPVALHGTADQEPDYIPEDLRKPESITSDYSTVGRSVDTPAHGESKAEKSKPYVYPPTSLMKAGDHKQRNPEAALQETARKLESTLQSFGVGVTVTNISCGPTVTQYELQPEPGVRVNKIQSLADDIQLNLAAADIRIEAPIPGKASIGIEVPNKENATVYLRDILESPEFKQHPAKTAFAVGQGISGEVIVTDLAKMPHLLIAGATGSGKSVCINTLVMSVLYKATPDEVRLIMIDPKVVELSVYNGIPHLMIPVVTDPKKAAGALNWAVAEMTDRYRKFADAGVRDLKGYNEKIRQEAAQNGEEAKTLPQIIIIVDELADLMMVAPGDVEDAICRLAQMARAAGLHLVLATQRPTVNVITGLIKANVPSRIAFSVSSGTDSRTIIDMNGAEKLLGKGDMLFYPSGFQKPVRVQGAFVSDGEVSEVVEYVKAHNTADTYSSAIEAQLASMENQETPGTAAAGNTNNGRDEYFAEAGRFIIDKQKASIGMLQRVFKIGFNRAARIMDQLAEAGVVSEDAGTKAREILMDMAQFEELLNELGMQ